MGEAERIVTKVVENIERDLRDQEASEAQERERANRVFGLHYSASLLLARCCESAPKMVTSNVGLKIKGKEYSLRLERDETEDGADAPFNLILKGVGKDKGERTVYTIGQKQVFNWREEEASLEEILAASEIITFLSKRLKKTEEPLRAVSHPLAPGESVISHPA